MTTKVALLRDVAKLLKKYEPADVSDAVSSLSKRKQRKTPPKSKSHATSNRTKKAGATKSLRSPKARSLARTKKLESTPTKSRKRNQEKNATRSRRVKTHVAATDGIRKSKLPEKQRGTTNQLIADTIESVNRHPANTPKSLLKDRGEDYAKWFRIISGDTGETKNGNLAAETTSREVDNPKERKEAIRHLRIRDLLLSGPFKLNSSSPNTSKIITFLPDGAIGMGQTYLVARWRLSGGKLELLDTAGTVQSRFVLSSDGRFLTQIMDPAAPSARTSQLVRIATKS